MKSTIETLRPRDKAWDEVIQQSSGYDFYHMSGYHALAEMRGEGKAFLFVYRENERSIALPLLLRRTADVPGLEDTPWWDAGSVYGYPGPISSPDPIPIDVLKRFQSSLEACLREMQVVDVFSRLHPLLRQGPLILSLGEVQRAGPTASIDLSLPKEEQARAIDAKHRNQINKLRRLGVTCFWDREWRFFRDFVDLYHETMRKVGAGQYYYFDTHYFDGLRSALGDTIKLFVCRLANETICGGLFVLTNGIIQYHLSGTRNAYLRLAPMKLLIDTVRIWGNENKAKRFHLGGGLGAKEDGLFLFKRRFATSIHDFYVWRWVIDDRCYKELCTLRRRALDAASIETHGYFPAYRQ